VIFQILSLQALEHPLLLFAFLFQQLVRGVFFDGGRAVGARVREFVNAARGRLIFTTVRFARRRRDSVDLGHQLRARFVVCVVFEQQTTSLLVERRFGVGVDEEAFDGLRGLTVVAFSVLLLVTKKSLFSVTNDLHLIFRGKLSQYFVSLWPSQGAKAL